MRHVVALAAALLLAPRAASAERDYQLVDTGGAGALRVKRTPHVIYMNRCVGGCRIYPGSNDAETNHSSLVTQTSNISEFQYSDLIWDAVVACVRDAWAPYDVEVITEEPADGVDYVEAIVAGRPSEIGQPSTTLGYSPMANDCSPNSNWIAFSFANQHGADPTINLCATVAHETGHVFGLDHTLTCKDPMSYDMGCGVKHYLNLPMECGEDSPRECQCTGDRLNTHRHLYEKVGEGTPPPPPMVTIPYPTDGQAVIDRFAIFGDVVEDRIVDRVEFRLNGFPWRIAGGNLDDSSYSYTTEAELPDGIIDIEVRAYNDLQIDGSAFLTVQKGEPCTSASQCLDAQFCEEGRCAWPEPTIELGEECVRDADCVTYKCASDGTVSLCSAVCVPGDNSTCGDGFTCLQDGDVGACWPTALIDDGGCCSSSGGDGSILLASLLYLSVRRRRFASAALAPFGKRAR